MGGSTGCQERTSGFFRHSVKQSCRGPAPSGKSVTYLVNVFPYVIEPAYGTVRFAKDGLAFGRTTTSTI
jgi:hypothetical protein